MSPAVEVQTVKIDLSKFTSTEFVAFVVLTAIATAAMFVGIASYEAWAGTCVGLAVNLGVMRRVKAGQAIKAANGKNTPAVESSSPGA